MASGVREHLLDFDIDRYLNPIVPKSRLYLLPKVVSHWLGYRESPPSKVNNLLAWAWAFIGCFCGVALIEGVFKASPLIQDHSPPVIIGSFGAAAILSYSAIESPLGQPRHAVGGQIVGALCGVAIAKLFELLPPSRFSDLQWLAGALAVASTSAVMNVTKTVHPPAGATALLAATSPDITKLGWYYIALVALASALMLGSSLVINNIQRRYPLYWWTAADLSREARKPQSPNSEDEEKKSPPPKQSVEWNDSSSEDFSEAGVASVDRAIVVLPGKILIPESLIISPESRALLEQLRLKLADQNR